MSTFNDKLKIISEYFVKPKYETEPSKKPHLLGPCDLIFLSLDQIQKGLLFSKNRNNIQFDLIETLKESLAISLVHFYPLAGRLTTQYLPDENSKWVYLDCAKGPGARLVHCHATVDVTVSNLLSSVDVHPIVRFFFDLGQKSINEDGHTRPLLSIQVTELVDGFFIGFTLNHSVVDGSSEWHFINSLSEVFTTLSKNKESGEDFSIIISRNPVFGTYFPRGWGPILKMPIVDKDSESLPWEIQDRVLLRERIFHFSSEAIRKLKSKANEECRLNNNTISSFQALSGLIWRSITRARKLEPEFETSFWLSMNARSRLSPPVSNEYFGNMLVTQKCIGKVGEVLDNGLGWASMLIHKLVTSQTEDQVRDFYENLARVACQGWSGADLDWARAMKHRPNLVTIGGSARFDMYRPEFGFGKAEAVLQGYCHKEDGKVTANPGREGGGSVDLEVCLQPDTMLALESDENFMSYVTQQM